MVRYDQNWHRSASLEASVFFPISNSLCICKQFLAQITSEIRKHFAIFLMNCNRTGTGKHLESFLLFMLWSSRPKLHHSKASMLVCMSAKLPNRINVISLSQFNALHLTTEKETVRKYHINKLYCVIYINLLSKLVVTAMAFEC